MVWNFDIGILSLFLLRVFCGLCGKITLFTIFMEAVDNIETKIHSRSGSGNDQFPGHSL